MKQELCPQPRACAGTMPLVLIICGTRSRLEDFVELLLYDTSGVEIGGLL